MNTQLHLSAPHYRSVMYWSATLIVVAELGMGGAWDLARAPTVRDLVIHLGYPTYFLVLLGAWKILGAAALLLPRCALLKEWAYAGTFFVYSGAITSHISTGYARNEILILTVLVILTVTSWALRPPTRRFGRAIDAGVRRTGNLEDGIPTRRFCRPPKRPGTGTSSTASHRKPSV